MDNAEALQVQGADKMHELDNKDREIIERAYAALLEARAHRDTVNEQIKSIQSRIETELTPKVEKALEEYRNTVQLIGYKHGISAESEGTWTLNNDRTALILVENKGS